jgi:hypothetical protein
MSTFDVVGFEKRWQEREERVRRQHEHAVAKYSERTAFLKARRAKELADYTHDQRQIAAGVSLTISKDGIFPTDLVMIVLEFVPYDLWFRLVPIVTLEPPRSTPPPPPPPIPQPSQNRVKPVNVAKLWYMKKLYRFPDDALNEMGDELDIRLVAEIHEQGVHSLIYVDDPDPDNGRDGNETGLSFVLLDPTGPTGLLPCIGIDWPTDRKLRGTKPSYDKVSKLVWVTEVKYSDGTNILTRTQCSYGYSPFTQRVERCLMMHHSSAECDDGIACHGGYIHQLFSIYPQRTEAELCNNPEITGNRIYGGDEDVDIPGIYFTAGCLKPRLLLPSPVSKATKPNMMDDDIKPTERNQNRLHVISYDHQRKQLILYQYGVTQWTEKPKPKLALLLTHTFGSPIDFGHPPRFIPEHHIH